MLRFSWVRVYRWWFNDLHRFPFRGIEAVMVCTSMCRSYINRIKISCDVVAPFMRIIGYPTLYLYVSKFYRFTKFNKVVLALRDQASIWRWCYVLVGQHRQHILKLLEVRGTLPSYIHINCLSDPLGSKACGVPG